LLAGAHRSEADAAVAHDQGGHAVPARGGEDRIPGDLAVVVRVHIDPARRDEQIARVDLAAPAPADLAHRGNRTAVDGDVAHNARATGPVDDRTVTNHQIVHALSVCVHRTVPPSARRTPRTPAPAVDLVLFVPLVVYRKAACTAQAAARRSK